MTSLPHDLLILVEENNKKQKITINFRKRLSWMIIEKQRFWGVDCTTFYTDTLLNLQRIGESWPVTANCTQALEYFWLHSKLSRVWSLIDRLKNKK